MSKDQPVDELDALLSKYVSALHAAARHGLEGDFIDVALPNGVSLEQALRTHIQAECNRARVDELEQLPPHTTKLGYSYLVDRIAELQQIMKEGE